MVNRIIINFPTNFGDAILTFPALDLIKSNFPQAKIVAICSSKTKDFLSHHNFIDELIVYNKRWRIKDKIRFCASLRKKNELMVDFKNSFLPIILKAKFYTPFVRIYPKNMHVKDRYIKLVKNLVQTKIVKRGEFLLKKEERDKWDSLDLNNSIFVSSASHSSLKTYPSKNLKKVVEVLSKNYKVVLLGDSKASDYYRDITKKENVINLAGKTTFLEVYYLLKNYASLCISVDSSILHLASYLNIPIVAIFGPTVIHKYGPWSNKFKVLVRSDLACRPCEHSVCRFDNECMDIEPEKIIESINSLIKDV